MNTSLPGSLPLMEADPLRRERRLVAILIAAFFASILLLLAQPFFSRDSWMIFLQDDVFYYLKVAQNIVRGHGSTFNGIVPTNGYQPLWLLLLVAVRYATADPRLLLGFFALTDLAASAITFVLARRLLRGSSARPLLEFALTAWVTLYSLALFFFGMEVTLTVPLLFGVLCLARNVAWLEQSAWHTCALGLLLSATALSRLDTLIFALLLLLGVGVKPALRSRLVRPHLILGAALGLLPLAFYFVFNHRLFGMWLPVSGLAKQLKSGLWPSSEPWRIFLHPFRWEFPALILVAAALLQRVSIRLSAMDRVLFPAVMLFPALYYTILSCRSDWMLWGWYLYPLRPALCIGFLVLCLWPPCMRWMQQPAVTAALVVSVFTALAVLRWTRQQADIQAATVPLQAFIRQHPGTYAMGDRAGRIAYLIDEPVIQLEGLMMDREFLDILRQQLPMRVVLRSYGVRYYIATAYQPFPGCFQASEPAQAGPASPHLRGEFCEAPAARFENNGITTLIFDVGTSRSSAASTDKVHHLEAVTFRQRPLAPGAAADNVAVQLDRHPVALESEGGDQVIEGGGGSQDRKGAGLAVQHQR